MLVWLSAASSGDIWRSLRLPDGVFTFNGHVETSARMTAAALHAQVASERQEGNAHGPPLGTIVVDVDVSGS